LSAKREQRSGTGIMPVGDAEIRALTAGRTVRIVNLMTGQSAILHFSRALGTRA
jgi:hypothetical protein